MQQKGFVVRKFTTLCSPLPCVEEKPLQLSQKSVLCMGQAKYDSVEAIHTLCKLVACVASTHSCPPLPCHLKITRI